MIFGGSRQLRVNGQRPIRVARVQVGHDLPNRFMRCSDCSLSSPGWVSITSSQRSTGWHRTQQVQEGLSGMMCRLPPLRIPEWLSLGPIPICKIPPAVGLVLLAIRERRAPCCMENGELCDIVAHALTHGTCMSMTQRPECQACRRVQDELPHPASDCSCAK